MATTSDFQVLIQRVRAGDPDATAEFVRSYEPAIRRAARIRMVDPRLGRHLDSMDIAQSVFASFFVRVALGEFELSDPEQALSLLLSMGRRKLADRARRESAARRDYRRTSGLGVDARELTATSEDPCQTVATQELIGQFRNRMTAEERELADLRAGGQEWSDIAAERGGSAEALRKQLGRAVSRVAHALGIEDAVDA